MCSSETIERRRRLSSLVLPYPYYGLHHLSRCTPPRQQKNFLIFLFFLLPSFPRKYFSLYGNKVRSLPRFRSKKIFLVQHRKKTHPTGKVVDERKFFSCPEGIVSVFLNDRKNYRFRFSTEIKFVPSPFSFKKFFWCNIEKKLSRLGGG